MAPFIVDLTDAITSRAPEPIPKPVPKPHSPTAILEDAINNASKRRLLEVLQGVCDKSLDASRIISSLLLVPEDDAVDKIIEKSNITDDEEEFETESEDEEDEDEDEEENEEGSDVKDRRLDVGEEPKERPRSKSLERPMPGNGQKRLRSRYAICANCREEFDVTSNDKHDCVWHTGELIHTHFLRA